jgi:hypothetical protein
VRDDYTSVNISAQLRIPTRRDASFRGWSTVNMLSGSSISIDDGSLILDHTQLICHIGPCDLTVFQPLYYQATILLIQSHMIFNLSSKKAGLNYKGDIIFNDSISTISIDNSVVSGSINGSGTVIMGPTYVRLSSDLIGSPQSTVVVADMLTVHSIEQSVTNTIASPRVHYVNVQLHGDQTFTIWVSHFCSRPRAIQIALH